MGAALAFLPFEERPLERWIFAFFRSIYSPTLYFWKKTEKPPVFFTEVAISPTITTVANTGPVVEKDTAKLEEAEKSFLSKIGGLWNVSSTPPVQTSTVVVAPPQTIAPIIPTVLTTPQQIPTVITKSAPRLVVEESGPRVGTLTPVATTEISVEKVEEKEITSNSAEFSIDAKTTISTNCNKYNNRTSNGSGQKNN